MELTSELVSVVIPLYNAREYIERTIESVLKQTYANIEVIVVDDCSSDDGTAIVRTISERDNRVRLIILEKNYGGPAKARNVGIEHARGKYIAFLDADDVWERNKIEEQLTYLRLRNKRFTSCGARYIDANDREVRESFLKRIYKKFVRTQSICDLIKNNFIVTSSVVVEKELIVPFCESKEYVSVEDFDVWLRILERFPQSYVYQPSRLVRYRLLENSISSRKNIYKQEVRALIVLSRFVLRNERYMRCYLFRIAKIFLRRFV